MSENNDTFLRGMQVAAGVDVNGGQAEVAAPESPAPTDQVSAEVAVETAPIEETPQETPTETHQAEEQVSQESFNYWSELEQKTEGLVKDEQALLSLVERAKQYETLATEKEELEKNKVSFANDYVRSLNEMYQNGANEDQLRAYRKINEYGDLESLDPKSIKVAKMVLKDGYSQATAEKIVEREFDLNEYEEGTDEHEITKEKLRVSANNDLKELQQYRKDLSVVHNPEKEQAEQHRLQEIANITNYNKIVDTEASKIAQHFPQKMSYEIKIGEETLQFEDNIDQEFAQKHLPGILKDYFADSLDELNSENIQTAYSYAYGEYLKQAVPKLVNTAYNKGFALGQERTMNKYENLSGLPRAEENNVVETAGTDAYNDFVKKQVLGKK